MLIVSELVVIVIMVEVQTSDTGLRPRGESVVASRLAALPSPACLPFDLPL